MLGQMAVGSLQGKQQAQQENDAEQQRREQQTLQTLPILQSIQERQQQQRLGPYDILSHLVGQMPPEQQAEFYTKYTNAAVPQGPGIDYGGIAKTFDPDSPLRSLFAGMGGPAGPVPTAVGFPGTATAPGGAAPIPGAAGPSAVAPGGAPGAPHAKPVPTVQAPFGSFQIGGDPKQLAAIGSEVARIAAHFGGQNLDSQFRTQAGTLVQRATQQVQSRDLAGAQQTQQELRALETQIPEKERAAGHAAAQYDAGRYDRLFNQFRTKTSKGAAAYSDISQLYDLEQRNQARGKERPEWAQAGMERLSGYDAQIAEMQGQFAEAKTLRGQLAGMTPADRQAAQKRIAELDKAWQGTAESLHDMLHFDVAPRERAAAIGQVRGFLQMLAPGDRTPENVARLLETNGNPKMAALVRERGLNFGGADAERQTQSMLKSLPNIFTAGTPETVRQAFADRLRQESQLTGHPISLSVDQVVKKGADIPGSAAAVAAADAHLRAYQELRRLKAQNAVEIQGGRWAEADLNIQIKRAKRDQALGLLDPALERSARVAQMRNLQHKTDQSWSNYHAWLRENAQSLEPGFNPDYWLQGGDNPQHPEIYQKSHKLDDLAAIGVQLYADWQTKDKAAQASFSQVLAQQKQARKNAAQSGAGRQTQATQPAKATAAGGDRTTPRMVTIRGQQVNTSPAALYEFLQSQIQAGRMTPAAVNQEMRTVFGAR